MGKASKVLAAASAAASTLSCLMAPCWIADYRYSLAVDARERQGTPAAVTLGAVEKNAWSVRFAEFRCEISTWPGRVTLDIQSDDAETWRLDLERSSLVIEDGPPGPIVVATTEWVPLRPQDAPQVPFRVLVWASDRPGPPIGDKAQTPFGKNLCTSHDRIMKEIAGDVGRTFEVRLMLVSSANQRDLRLRFTVTKLGTLLTWYA